MFWSNTPITNAIPKSIGETFTIMKSSDLCNLNSPMSFGTSFIPQHCPFAHTSMPMPLNFAIFDGKRKKQNSPTIIELTEEEKTSLVVVPSSNSFVNCNNAVFIGKDSSSMINITIGNLNSKDKNAKIVEIKKESKFSKRPNNPNKAKKQKTNSEKDLTIMNIIDELSAAKTGFTKKKKRSKVKEKYSCQLSQKMTQYLRGNRRKRLDRRRRFATIQMDSKTKLRTNGKESLENTKHNIEFSKQPDQFNKTERDDIDEHNDKGPSKNNGDILTKQFSDMSNKINKETPTKVGGNIDQIPIDTINIEHTNKFNRTQCSNTKPNLAEINANEVTNGHTFYLAKLNSSKMLNATTTHHQDATQDETIEENASKPTETDAYKLDEVQSIFEENNRRTIDITTQSNVIEDRNIMAKKLNMFQNVINKLINQYCIYNFDPDYSKKRVGEPLNKNHEASDERQNISNKRCFEEMIQADETCIELKRLKCIETSTPELINNDNKHLVDAGLPTTNEFNETQDDAIKQKGHVGVNVRNGANESQNKNRKERIKIHGNVVICPKTSCKPQKETIKVSNEITIQEPHQTLPKLIYRPSESIRKGINKYESPLDTTKNKVNTSEEPKKNQIENMKNTEHYNSEENKPVEPRATIENKSATQVTNTKKIRPKPINPHCNQTPNPIIQLNEVTNEPEPSFSKTQFEEKAIESPNEATKQAKIATCTENTNKQSDGEVSFDALQFATAILGENGKDNLEPLKHLEVQMNKMDLPDKFGEGFGFPTLDGTVKTKILNQLAKANFVEQCNIIVELVHLCNGASMKCLKYLNNNEDAASSKDATPDSDSALVINNDGETNANLSECDNPIPSTKKGEVWKNLLTKNGTHSRILFKTNNWDLFAKPREAPPTKKPSKVIQVRPPATTPNNDVIGSIIRQSAETSSRLTIDQPTIQRTRPATQFIDEDTFLSQYTMKKIKNPRNCRTPINETCYNFPVQLTNTTRPIEAHGKPPGCRGQGGKAGECCQMDPRLKLNYLQVRNDLITNQNRQTQNKVKPSRPILYSDQAKDPLPGQKIDLESLVQPNMPGKPMDEK